ncbi:hypothetical protein MKW92_032896, partial [Papaver armeniacum]
GEKKDGPTHKTLPKKDLDVENYEDDVAVGDVSLVPVFDGYETDDSIEEGSDSDEFLPETFEGAYDAAGESDDESEGNDRPLQAQNKELRLELAKQKKKLDRLIEKVMVILMKKPKLVTRIWWKLDSSIGKPLTTAIIDSWCRLILEEKNLSVLPNLLNAYRVACQYGSGDAIDAISQRIQSSKTFVKIVNFTFVEADNIFRTHLEIPSPDCEKHTTREPLIQSYLSSTIILLNHVTDSEILAFALTRLRASTIFFAAFPSLLKKLIKVTVHLWATGEGKVPSASFLIMRDAATQLSLNCLESCLIKTYKAFIARSKFLEPTNLLHIRFLADSLVELYSLDVPRSCSKALVSIQQLATILRQCLHTKEKETMEKIYSWQYINCVDLWVKYVCANVEDNDLQLLVGSPFSGPRHLPLRVKCIKMLNQLSSTSRDFILALSVIELLSSSHFAQWSYHISFPELFNEKTTVESLRRPVKRLVEQNVEFVNKKREEVAFSPKDKAAVDSFLQEIKVESKQTPFTQYYTDIIKRSLSRGSVMQSTEEIKKGEGGVPKKSTNKENAEKSSDSTQSGRIEGRKGRKEVMRAVNQLQRNQPERESWTTVRHDNTTAEDSATDVSKQAKADPVVQKSNGRRDVRKVKKMKTQG